MKSANGCGRRDDTDMVITTAKRHHNGGRRKNRIHLFDSSGVTSPCTFVYNFAGGGQKGRHDHGVSDRTKGDHRIVEWSEVRQMSHLMNIALLWRPNANMRSLAVAFAAGNFCAIKRQNVC